ncbi:methyltransferase type 11 [Haloprofundus marisrubri]|uniref:Methyltransferase type 11 n=1 Tax=Haloprofundus marisrubri TaxID=1514971 RepID=A0A0W1RDK2_9EURY|nr:methyltransferase domain-containing protein [Haloprofundus marisrubri]KTG11519.1 methyltransferase type 11 [Haloprofundus marisrubri]
MTANADERDGASVYDWWSRHPRAFDLLYGFAFLGREEEIRQQSLDVLAATSGEWILELGCGPGNSFESLRSAVGRSGTVVGFDASDGMVREATTKIRRAGWQNVHAVRADALRPPFDAASFDAIYASMSLSAVPDPKRAIETAKTLLRPGGRLVVLDGQPFQERPWTLANAVVVPVSKRTTDWQPEIHLPSVLRCSFDSVDVRTFNAGTVLLACARKSASETG